MAVVAAIAALGLVPGGVGAAGRGKGPKSVHLANACFALRSSETGRFVAVSADTYGASQRRKSAATPFFWKPASLGSFLPRDEGGGLLTVTTSGSVARAASPGPAARWSVAFLSGGRAALFSSGAGRELGIARSGRLVLQSPRARRHVAPFRLSRTRGCSPFPEADVSATGRPFRGTDRRGNVRGFADLHLHITANQRAGGAVIYGEPFDRYGITEALGHDADVHGADGSEDVTGNLLRTGLPFGTHDTHGWPTFAGWPVNDTITHQQTYYVWLKRAWMAGERLVVAQTVEDQPICELEPVKVHSCDETEAIRQQIQTLRGLQGYVDAQAGGTGRGWFRLVFNPRQAREAIEKGRLAVVIGIESSNLFGCSERNDVPECTRKDVDRGIRNARRLGVRSVFPMHWTDNAFGGSALEGGDKGTFINLLEAFQTGHYFRTGPCPESGQGEELRTLSPLELSVLASFFPAAAPLAQAGMPTYPPGRQCNSNGLTPLGRYLIRRLIANHMLIEVDHMSEWAREAVLRIAKRRRYPLVSSHTGTGGAWTPTQLKLLYKLGGIAAATPDTASGLAAKIESFKPDRAKGRYFGVALGTDTGGFSSLPGPRVDAAQSPLLYPFRSFVGKTVFQRERSGNRTFDLNTDGVAHYGLIPDLLADMQQYGGGPAMRSLFRSAEAYLRTWELARAR